MFFSYRNVIPLGIIPRNIPLLMIGGPLNPLGIEFIGPPLPIPLPLLIQKFTCNLYQIEIFLARTWIMNKLFIIRRATKAFEFCTNLPRPSKPPLGVPMIQ